MLARHVRVDVLGRNTGLARDKVAQAGGVEHRARTEDLVAGQSRELERHVGDDVNGVRDEHEAGVRGHVLQVRHDLLHKVDGRTGQLKARLSGLLLRASSHDDQVGTTNDLNVVGALN